MLVIVRLNDKILPKLKVPEDVLQRMEWFRNYFILSEGTCHRGDELVKLFELKDKVMLRKVINHLRMNGLTVISCGRCGYKYTTNKEELKQYCTKLQHRGLTILSVARQIKNNM